MAGRRGDRRGHPADQRRRAPTPTPGRLRTGSGCTRCARRSTRRPRPVRVALDGSDGRARCCSAGRPRRCTPSRRCRDGDRAPHHRPDGTPLRAWLALPHDASAADPAPLLLWIHGGPLATWNAWSWRWNPWLMVVRATRCCCPILHCRRATASTSSAVGGGMGRGSVHGPHGGHRRGAGARRHRRRPHCGDGRVVRRLHGQLGRRPHRPVPRDRHARAPVVARPVRRRPPTPPTTGTRDDTGDGRGQLAAPVRRRRSARRCS